MGSPTCKICLQGRTTDKLIQPCRCETFVHKSCLDQERRTTDNAKEVSRCVFCQSAFRFDGSYRASKAGRIARVAWANVAFHCFDTHAPEAHRRSPSPRHTNLHYVHREIS